MLHPKLDVSTRESRVGGAHIESHLLLAHVAVTLVGVDVGWRESFPLDGHLLSCSYRPTTC